MRLSVLFWLLAVTIVNGQTTKTIQFYSSVLNEYRNIRIHIPESSGQNGSKENPLILCLDGEYLFYSMLGPYEISRIRGDLPESVIVGIDQNYPDGNYPARWNDCSYDYNSGDLEGKGITFKKFILEELIPHLIKEYHVGKFRIIAGHSYTANYVNYFLGDTTFSGFIAISPYIPDSAEPIIRAYVQGRERTGFYYLSTSDKDLYGHIPQIRKQDSILFKQIAGPGFCYAFRDYIGENHHSLVTRSITDALYQMFLGYLPLYSLTEADKYIAQEQDILEYLDRRYQEILRDYGLSIAVREDDLAYLWGVLEDKKDWVQLKEAGEYTIGLYPGSIYGYYMKGSAEENMNNLYEALRLYKAGYEKLSDDILNKSDFYENIEHVENLIRKGN